MKKRLLVSFSGGETSAYMASWLWKFRRDEYEIIFVFANTGQENEETLKFVEQCSAHFEFPVVWVEPVVYYNERKGSTHKIVNFKSANRDGKPFEDVIKKYGIPNMNTPHCTRELKENPIRSYARAIGWANDYETAIGIRCDEIDRMNTKRKDLNLVYPLITMQPMNKPKINAWWKLQPFRLQLKGYQGNCITCWKKGDQKLFQIYKENPASFNFFGKMELRYGKFIPDTRLQLMFERGETPKMPVTFFRKHRSVETIIEQAKKWNGNVIDDSQLTHAPDLFDNIDLIGGDSCEIFSECSDT